MKDHLKTEIAATDDAHAGRARVWLGPGLPRTIEPLLSGLGIELLAPLDRERATIRVEAVAADARAGPSTEGLRTEGLRTEGLRIDRADSETRDAHGVHEAIEHEAVEFEGPAVWAAASYVVSQAFGLFPPLLTADAAMFAVIRAAASAGQVDSPILVTGETGTGKELLVRLIHAASGRAGGMASVNCAALNDPVPLSESVTKDVSDDAEGDEHRLQTLCAASDTTLFLDQVSELSPVAQTRVMYAILRGADGVAGAVRPGARLVSATNRPLGPLVLSGEFKRDLYGRLAVLTLALPPLRERRSDIGLLAAAFLRAVAPQLGFTPGALKVLGNYPFPGNVRELHNLITRLAIMPRDGAGRLIDTADVRAQFVAPVMSASIWKSSPFRMRREMAMQALMACGGDRAEAARKLGISVRALLQHVVSGAPSTAPRNR
ncbi:MAG TPA: sigma 54-interacting transcriptional regulator [Candidatus Binataceae bacterium]|nr:sigma 54-interacting transcriptional regulator [Candidatus Binataceae bacterium]